MFTILQDKIIRLALYFVIFNHFQFPILLNNTLQINVVIAKTKS